MSKILICDPHTWAVYFEDSTTKGRSSAEMNHDAQKLEVLHIANIALYNWEELWIGPTQQRLEGNLSSGIFFNALHLIPKVATVRVYMLTHLSF